MTDAEKALAVRSKLSGKFYVGQRVRVNAPAFGVLNELGTVEKVENFNSYVVSGIRVSVVYAEEMRPA